ncbi:MAG: mycothiol synthase [Acidimicrobiales bacterium]
MRRLTIEPGVEPVEATTPGGPSPSRQLEAVARRVADPTTSVDELAELLAEAVGLVGSHPGWSLVLDAEPAPDELDAVARGAGFAPTRTLLQMRRTLPVPPADRGHPPAAGAPLLRAFRPGVDDAAWLAVNNRAFTWHPEQGGWTQHDLDERLAAPWFRADGFLVHDRTPGAAPGGAIDAFCWTKIHADHDPPLGEIFVIGVDPDAHGRGLGRALTLAGLDWLAAQGLGVGMLYVEADNDSAVSLYRDLGFTEHLVHRWWRSGP